MPGPDDADGTAPMEGSIFVSKGITNVAALLAADAEDESLRRYKATLLGSAAAANNDVNPYDLRRVVITRFSLLFDPSQEEGAPTELSFALNTAEGVQALQAGISMKEGARFKLKISFRVQRDEIVVGIRFTNAVSRLLFTETEELMIGSYPPSSSEHTFEFPRWDYNEAPVGMMSRGTYKVVNKIFCSTEGNKPLAEFHYPLTIVKRNKEP